MTEKTIRDRLNERKKKKPDPVSKTEAESDDGFLEVVAGLVLALGAFLLGRKK